MTARGDEMIAAFERCRPHLATIDDGALYPGIVTPTLSVTRTRLKVHLKITHVQWLGSAEQSYCPIQAQDGADPAGLRAQRRSFSRIVRIVVEDGVARCRHGTIFFAIGIAGRQRNA